MYCMRFLLIILILKPGVLFNKAGKDTLVILQCYMLLLDAVVRINEKQLRIFTSRQARHPVNGLFFQDNLGKLPLER